MMKFEIENKVRHIVSEVLRTSPISLEMDYSLYANGADSLDVLDILVDIESELSIKFDNFDTEVFGRKTLNEITDMIKGLTEK